MKEEVIRSCVPGLSTAMFSLQARASEEFLCSAIHVFFKIND